MSPNSARILTIVFLACGISTAARAQSISVGGNVSLHITACVPGSAPTSVTGTTTYSVTTVTGSNWRISGKLNSNMPSGLTLRVNLQAPTGGSSQGTTTLTTSNQNLVTNINANTNQSGLTVTFTLQATTAAGPVASGTRTVTLTLVNGG